MFGIGQFFQKIHNSFTREVLQRSIVSEVIKKHTGAQIPIESISFSGNSALLKGVSSSAKASIFIKKQRIILELKERGISKVKDLR